MCADRSEGEGECAGSACTKSLSRRAPALGPVPMRPRIDDAATWARTESQSEVDSVAHVRMSRAQNTPLEYLYSSTSSYLAESRSYSACRRSPSPRNTLRHVAFAPGEREAERPDQDPSRRVRRRTARAAAGRIEGVPDTSRTWVPSRQSWRPRGESSSTRCDVSAAAPTRSPRLGRPDSVGTGREEPELPEAPAPRFRRPGSVLDGLAGTKNVPPPAIAGSKTIAYTSKSDGWPGRCGSPDIRGSESRRRRGVTLGFPRRCRELPLLPDRMTQEVKP